MPTPELKILRECQDRVLEREGIPMVLALVSEVGQVPNAVDSATRAAGEALAGEVDRYRARMVPSSRDDDNGCLISVLQAVSYADFGTSARPLPATAAELPRRDIG